MVGFDDQSAERVVRAVKTVEKLFPQEDTPYDLSTLFQFKLLEDAGDSEETEVEIQTPDGFQLDDTAILVDRWGMAAGEKKGYEDDCYYYDGKYYTVYGRGARVYQYVLTSDWSNGDATADIYTSDKATNGVRIDASASIYDPTRQSLMVDQVLGDVGWCHKQNDVYYAWQAPCDSASGGQPPPSTGGGGPPISSSIITPSNIF